MDISEKSWIAAFAVLMLVALIAGAIKNIEQEKFEREVRLMELEIKRQEGECP